jgi:hypothetical protein
MDRRKRREENEELLGQARLKMLAVHAKNALFGIAQAPLPASVRKPEPDMFALPALPEAKPISTRVHAVPHSTGVSDAVELAMRSISPVLNTSPTPSLHDEDMIETPDNVDDIFSPDFEALPLRMQVGWQGWVVGWGGVGVGGACQDKCRCGRHEVLTGSRARC